MENTNLNLNHIFNLTQRINNLNTSVSLASEKVDIQVKIITDTKNKLESAENIRVSNENTRIQSETNRASAETTRIDAENKRITAEKLRDTAEKARILSDVKREAIYNADRTAVDEAARVNAQLEGTKICITNRKGEISSLELVDIDEHVTVKLISKVDNLGVSNTKISVFRNHGETPEIYTTGDDGTVTFTVTRGTYYEIHFPDAGSALSISPIGYTATLPVRTIEVTYRPASDGPLEHVVIETKKVLLDGDGTKEVFPNIDFTIQIADGEVLKFSTNTNGLYELDIPASKKYKVIFSSQSGLYTTTKLTKEFTASSSNRNIRLTYYNYKSGVFVVTDDGLEYTLDLFKELNIDKTKAKMVAVYEKNLVLNNGVIYASINDLSTANYPNRLWCNLNVLFKDIPSQGNNSNAMYYYDGNGLTNAILLEAEERLLVCGAASFAHSKLITIGENTMYGYLPSIGLMYIFIQNDTEIDNILKYIVGDTTKTVANLFRNALKWTSSLNGDAYAWGFTSDCQQQYTKTYSHFVAWFYAY